MSTTSGIGSCRDGVCLPPSAVDDSTEIKRDSDPSDSGRPTPTPIKIQIISDTMCPWCWVGRRNLGKALQSCGDLVTKADIEWLPFFLDRHLPEEGKPVKDYYRDNYGNPNAGEDMKPHLTAAGRRVSINFEVCYNKLERYRPTIRSHRLIEYAKRHGKQEEMVERMFQMYYIEGGHLNCIPDLVQAAMDVGLEDEKAVEEYLKSGQDEQEVDELAAKVKPLAFGVPTFLISRCDATEDGFPFRLAGARAPRAFVDVFRKLAAEG